jgi:hypothetical protein
MENGHSVHVGNHLLNVVRGHNKGMAVLVQVNEVLQDLLNAREIEMGERLIQ